MLRVLVIEDSLTMQAVITEVLTSDPAITVIGSANNGLEGLQQTLRLKPDVITMDIRMPVMDGFEATRRIMEECPTPIVVVSASINSPDLNISFNALRAGALDVVEKPAGDGANFEAIRDRLINTVKVMSEVKTVRRRAAGGPSAAIAAASAAAMIQPPLGRLANIPPLPSRASRPPAPAAYSQPPVSASSGSSVGMQSSASASSLKPAAGASSSGLMSVSNKPAILAIGSSTGGPAALNVVLKELPLSLPVPVVIVQHIAKGFTQGLVDWLQSECALPIKIAKQDERIYPGEIYFAPDEEHMILQRRGILGLKRSPPVSFVRPSVTVLFESIAKLYGQQAVAAILTGMGDDGGVGLKQIHDAGGWTLAQDQATSVVYGMPRVAAELGAVDRVAGLEEIAGHLTRACSRTSTFA